MKREVYKGYIIEDNTTRWGGKQYTIYDEKELFVMNCGTKKECKEKINMQIRDKKQEGEV